MNRKTIVILMVVLVLSIGNYFRLFSGSTIRTVEFLSIFAIGLVAGILLNKLFGSTSSTT